MPFIIFSVCSQFSNNNLRKINYKEAFSDAHTMLSNRTTQIIQFECVCSFLMPIRCTNNNLVSSEKRSFTLRSIYLIYIYKCSIVFFLILAHFNKYDIKVRADPEIC